MHHALDTRYIVYLYTYISTQKAATVFSTYYVGTYCTLNAASIFGGIFDYSIKGLF